MAREPNDLLHGTLDVLILKTLSWGPAHGYGIGQWIEGQTRRALTVEDAALYKALHRLEASGAIVAEWGISDNNRRAKYYSLTPRGRQSQGRSSDLEALRRRRCEHTGDRVRKCNVVMAKTTSPRSSVVLPAAEPGRVATQCGQRDAISPRGSAHRRVARAWHEPRRR